MFVWFLFYYYYFFVFVCWVFFSGIRSVDQTGFELKAIHLPLPCKCWDQRRVPPPPGSFLILVPSKGIGSLHMIFSVSQHALPTAALHHVLRLCCERCTILEKTLIESAIPFETVLKTNYWVKYRPPLLRGATMGLVRLTHNVCAIYPHGGNSHSGDVIKTSFRGHMHITLKHF